jgi:hypothetical protein
LCVIFVCWLVECNDLNIKHTPCTKTKQTQVAAAIGGGYSPDHSVLVERHVLLHRAAAKHWPTFAAAAERRRRQQQQQQQPSSRVATETTV